MLECGDHVVGVGQAKGQLRGSGSAGYSFAHVFTISDGKINHFREYADPDEVLRSL